MRVIKKGIGRTVVLIGSFAIKFPSFRNGVLHFVYGMLANLLEGERWGLSKSKYLAPVYITGPFGLFSINKRYKSLLARRLTSKELERLPFINFDNNGNNAAMDNGQIVLIDYGNPGMYLDILSVKEFTE